MTDKKHEKIQSLVKRKIWTHHGRPSGIYAVSGYSINKQIGKKMGKPRTERINVKTNVLFHGAKSASEVRKIYSAFWSMDKYSPEKVIITKVKKVK